MGTWIPSEETTMTCVICRNGETAAGTTNITLQRADATVVLKQVPAEICNNCGEYYLSSEMSSEVLRRAESIIATGAEVAIQRFAA